MAVRLLVQDQRVAKHLVTFDHNRIPRKSPAALPNRTLKFMELKTEFLRELSDLLVSDLRSSLYYKQLSPAEQTSLEERLSEETAAGRLPLLPGALNQTMLEETKQKCAEVLGIEIPDELLQVYARVDGFSENGVVLYGAEYEADTSWATVVNENSLLRDALPEIGEKYLFIGESDLCYYVLEPESGVYGVVSRDTYEPLDHFESVNEIINDMLAISLNKQSERQSEGDQIVSPKLGIRP